MEDAPHQESRPCCDCGDMCEPGHFDFALHDCEEGEWYYICLAIPAGVAELTAAD